MVLNMENSLFLVPENYVAQRYTMEPFQSTKERTMKKYVHLYIHVSENMHED